MSFLKDPLHQRTDAGQTDFELADFLRPDANERRDPQLAAPDDSRDAESVEIVRRFEQLYAELTPAPEPQIQIERDDDLVIELPDDVRATENRWTTGTEAEGPCAPDYAAASAGEPPLTVDYPRSALATSAADPVLRGRHRAAPAVISWRPSEEPRDWSTSARRSLWPRLLIAAATALAVGVGTGYIAGQRSGSIAGDATIQATPDGGARLRLDYDLQRR
jgi:hypothetical protein